MKKLFTMFMVLAIVALFSVTVMATPPCEDGLVGLNITGNAGVGAVAYLGTANTIANTNSCFSNSTTVSDQAYVGVGITSSSAGNVCMTANGNTPGSISGTGSFNSGVEGSIMDVDFFTNSTVNVQGSNVGTP